MGRGLELLRQPWVQRAVRAALAAGLAGVVRIPYHASDTEPDDRDAAIDTAVDALGRLTTLLRSSDIADDEGFFALGAVTVGMQRSLQALEARVRFPPPA